MENEPHDIIEQSSIRHKDDNTEGMIDTSDNNQKPSQDKEEQELSPELQKLRELLKSDMKQVLIKPLEDRMSVLEESQKQFEITGATISAITMENQQLK